nr:hypothetical protein [Thermodesulfobacteriota bacterium]
MRLLEIIRAATGAIYLLGAIINLRFALFNLYVYQEFAKFALIFFYKILELNRNAVFDGMAHVGIYFWTDVIWHVIWGLV